MAIKILRGGLKSNQANGSAMGNIPMEDNQIPQEESFLGSAGRNIARTVSRNIPLAASIANPAVGAGLAGAELLQGLSGLYSNYVPQGLQDFLGDTSALMTEDKIAQARGMENPEQFQSVNPTDYLPTSANVQRGLQPYLPEGYLQPQAEGEQALDDFSTFAGAAYNPLLGGSPQSLTKAATRGGLAALGGLGARSAGMEGLPEFIVKAGSAALPDLYTLFTAPKEVEAAMKQGYSTAEKVGEYLPVKGNKLIKIMEKLEDSAGKFGDTSKSSALESNARRLINLADENGNYKASDLVKFKQSMNDLWGKGMNKVIHEINEPILNELKQLGEQVPLFGESFFPAEESWKALNVAGKAQKFIENNLPKHAKTSAFFYGLSQLMKGNVGQAAATAAVGPLAEKGAKFIDFVNGSTHAQKILGNMVENIAKDSTEPAIKSYNQLNTLYEKEIKKESKRPSSSIKILRGGLKAR